MHVQNAPAGLRYRARQEKRSSAWDQRPVRMSAFPVRLSALTFLKPITFSMFVTFLVMNYTTTLANTPPPEAPAKTDTPSESETEEPSAPKPTAVQSNDDNLMILEARLGNFTLTDGMIGYLNQGSLLLPLSEFAELLDLAIGVSPGTGTAEGWFLRENRLFSLDVNRGTVVIDGKTRPINPLLIGIFDDDIYVDVRMLADWFPVDINFDLSNLVIRFETREPFPIEQKLTRTNRRERLLSRQRADGSRFPILPQPYQLISWPVSDSSMEFSFKSGETGDERGIKQTTYMTAEIGKMSAELFLNADDKSILPQARFSLGRKDANGELLGDLEATEVSMGDIVTPNVSMVANTNLGRGFFVSSLPLENPSEFDRITLDGDLPSGWEVELYRNEVLLDFRTARADGRYVFEDVPLLFGVNILRLAFFGPQGQSRNDIRQIRVGPDQTKPGEFLYRFAANQKNRQLLIGDVEETTEDVTQGKNNYFGEFTTGITRNLSFAASFASIPLEDGRHGYVTASTRAAIGNVFGRIDVVRDLSEGWALKFGAQTSIAGITTIAEHIRLYDFESDVYEPTTNPTEHDTSLRLDGSLRVPGIPQVSYSLSSAHEQKRDGTTSSSVNNRLSTAVSGTTVTNSLKWQLDKSEDTKTTSVDGSFLVGGRVKKVRLRGQMGYTVRPIADVTSSSISTDWRVTDDLSASASLSHSFGEDSLTTLSGGVNTSFELAAVGLNVDYSTANDLNARLNLSFSSTRDPRDSGLVVRAEQTADTGAISVRVFLDENFNGVFDTGDIPLEGVRFKADGSVSKTKTDKDGIAFITGLDTYKSIDVEVDKGSLEDPFWISLPEGVSVVLRPGIAAQADFSVVTTGEIDGTVYRRSGEWAKEVRDVVVQLINADGTVAHRAESAYDGFYLLDFVRPGTYTLRVDPEQMARLNLNATAETEIVIEPDGTILNGMDIFLESDRASRSFRVLLVSFNTRDEAQLAWDTLLKDKPELLENLTPMVQVNERGGDTGVVFDLFAGPLESKEQASDLCINIREVRGEIWCNPLTVQAR